LSENRGSLKIYEDECGKGKGAILKKFPQARF
jgi:hypothetical protein